MSTGWPLSKSAISLLLLSVRLWWHPHWETVPSMPTARSELCHLARAHGAVRAV
ncbi:hypothetical protein AB0N98_36065 [Streptomyces sp. NPDC093681]|uniref:Uncharacterized protein n=1 Tax=Streptomyces salinarius TaxID=2762598 RepID=A0ABW8B8Y2_9ACTN